MATTTVPVTVTTSSKQFWLGKLDFLRALAVAALAAPLSLVYSAFQAGKFQVDWTGMWHLAVAGGVGYLIKNFLTPSQTTITGAPTGSIVNVTTPAAGATVTTTAVK
jgi:hypothetical protein